MNLSLLAKAYNHVAEQPISKFLGGGIFLKASDYNRGGLTVSYRLVRYTSDEDTVIWTVDFELPSSQRVSRNSHGTPSDGQVDLLSYSTHYGGYEETWHRGFMKLSKVKGDVAQLQRDLIIIRMFIEGENEVDHLKNG